MAVFYEPSFSREALTFDDVLLLPGHSEVMPGETDVRSRVTREIELNLPIMSSAMDTVTEARLASATAQPGGAGGLPPGAPAAFPGGGIRGPQPTSQGPA
eukprot:gene30030-33932_t